MNQLPKLVIGEYGFHEHINIQSWAEFQSGGDCRISVGGDMVEEPKLRKFHLQAYNYLIENQKVLTDLILNYLYKSYPELQEKYGYDEEEKLLFMPDLESKEELKQLIGISEVHIMNVEKNEMAYVGYQFKCKWDNEHGIGFMTHRDSIIDFGEGSVSFLTWVARKDLELQDDL